MTLLSVEGLRVDRGGRRVLDGVSFELQPGEALAIVGESGTGKSTLARALLRLVEPCGGVVRLRGRDLRAMPDRELRVARREVQLVFQDASASLDPRWTVASTVAEPLRLHGFERGPDEVLRLLRTVELGPELLHRHPHQLSGGQAQRVALARALAARPSLLIADEALNALDVSLRAQMANLIAGLRRSLDIACLFVTHDLQLAGWLCDRISVLAGGVLHDLASPAGAALLAAARALETGRPPAPARRSAPAP